jgi:hypothetical protein
VAGIEVQNFTTTRGSDAEDDFIAASIIEAT